MLKVLLVNTADIEGGAARACYRLHRGLQEFEIDSQLLVQKRNSDDPTVISPRTKIGKAIAKTIPSLDSLPCLLYPDRERTIYSIQWLPDRITSTIERLSPDIIHLHWVNGGFLRIETLARLKRPVVWTLHDMWPFTGGCHYSGECERYTDSCGACPQLGGRRERDLSRWIWQRKARAWQNSRPVIVTPSRWLAALAQRASLFQNCRIEVIPNGLDIQRYKPIEKKLARNLLGLPLDTSIVLFGADSATTERRKGFHLLLPALRKLGQLPTGKNGVELVVFGSSRPLDPPDFGFKTHYLGKLGDDISIALVYAAADVFVAPSLWDNLPNTVMEALACGTPCVAFQIGGMSDMIESGKNGYLAKPFDVDDLARGIAWVLEDGERYEKLSALAREKVEREFSSRLQAKSYLELYQQLCPLSIRRQPTE